MPGPGVDPPVSPGALSDRAHRARVPRAPGVAPRRQGAVGRLSRGRLSRGHRYAARLRAAPARRADPGEGGARDRCGQLDRCGGPDPGVPTALARWGGVARPPVPAPTRLTGLTRPTRLILS